MDPDEGVEILRPNNLREWIEGRSASKTIGPELVSNGPSCSTGASARTPLQAQPATDAAISAIHSPAAEADERDSAECLENTTADGSNGLRLVIKRYRDLIGRIIDAA